MTKIAREATKLKDSTKKLINHVEVNVEASIGEACLKISELQDLTEGSIVTIDRQINESVDLKVNGQIIGRGEIVAVDEKFAIRMTKIGD